MCSFYFSLSVSISFTFVRSLPSLPTASFYRSHLAPHPHIHTVYLGTLVLVGFTSVSPLSLLWLTVAGSLRLPYSLPCRLCLCFPPRSVPRVSLPLNSLIHSVLSTCLFPTELIFSLAQLLPLVSTCLFPTELLFSLAQSLPLVHLSFISRSLTSSCLYLLFLY